jgi:tetratricopeptide (TPR) repeat protein
MRFYSFLFLSYLLINWVPSQAQSDLYSLDNSLKFGEYLLQSGQYDYAIKEYERIVFMSPKNLDAQINLIKACRLANRNEEGIKRSNQLFENPSLMPEKNAMEYSKLLMNTREWDRAKTFWDNNENLKTEDKTLFKSTVSIFDSKFIQAREELLSLQDSTNYLGSGYLSIVDRALNQKKKSPIAAGFMSIVIPGLGKAYTGDWKDGLVSLIFTGGMAFQAVRKFNQHGANNYRPWIYTSIGAGFYLGNIYGSVKSAKNKNFKFVNALQHEASSLYNSYY